MKRNMMAKNLRQSIRRSLGRYIAIAVIIALGVAMFVGLRSTKMDMVATGQVYTDKQNMFDLRLIGSLGWGKEQVDDLAKLDGIVDAEGVFYTDYIVDRGGDGEESVYRFYTIPERINKLVLLNGRMPQTPDECLADGYRNSKEVIGTTLTIADNNSESSLEQLNTREFTIVGLISTPLYMDMNRGNTSVGSGSIANYFFVPEDAFDVDYYTEVHVTIPGEYAIYSQRYNDAMSDAADALEPQLAPYARQRLESVRREALESYRDGLKEYTDGVQELADARKEAKEQMDDAFRELVDGQDTLRHSEEQLISGEKQIADARATIVENKKELAKAKQQLANGKVTAFKEITNAIDQAVKNLQKMTQERQKIDSELFEIEGKLLEINTYILRFELGLIDASQAQKDEAYAVQEELEERRAELRAQNQAMIGSLSGLETRISSMTQQLVSMEEQFLTAEAQIEAGEATIAAYESELELQEKNIENGWKELEKGKRDLNRGWQEYFDGCRKAKQEFDDAEEKLADAKVQLQDAWQTITDLTENKVYVLDRNTNMGYVSLDSSSDIVAGVSRVFPVFFILVAALVCITTMTRMVDEERTQIGTLKALGYSSASIISKYLIYAGSSAVLGCIVGVAAGSIAFPMILWEAYKIMIFITPVIELRFDWALSAMVLVVYTSAMLLVTWYCCQRALEEVPAELIRPKAPTSGKALLIEKLPFWKNFSFLNKVAIRNIFRYRQRLAMMLLGIGGCTALLMTGYGIRDSISKIVDVQFQEVMVYDMEVYFREDCTPEFQEDFCKTMRPYAYDVMFFNQISAELSTEDQTRELYLISAGDEISDYFDFHNGNDAVALPQKNEVLLSAGICDIMGIKPGQEITMRNPDMEELHLTVSGIYDNHVHNYAIIAPETVEAQWGRTPELQMAFVKARPGINPNTAGAAANGAENVMNVTVSEQMADMVGHMMAALDLVVWVVVFCAALLAIIVLYNLTNININERIREIATIKVLGFNAMEAAMYVFKENLVLSIMGTVFGLPLGKLLLDFVISQIKIDMIWLKTRLEWQSLLISVVLTILSAVVVDAIFYFKLETINMAEALKSVE